MGLQLKPEQQRRLAAEQAVYRKFNNFGECAEACDNLAIKLGVNATFNRLSIQHYIGCQTNLSMKRLKILAEVLGITNYREMDEVFVAPKRRGEGDWWLGSDGNRIKDLDMTMMDRLNR